MREFLRRVNEATRDHPTVRVIGAVYIAVPLLILALAIVSYVQQSRLDQEVTRNCQRSAAIVTFIKETIPSAGPLGLTPIEQKLVDLERTLQSIGQCT